MFREKLFEFPAAVIRDPAVEAWFDARPGELGAIALLWFDVMRKQGDDVRELLHDYHPTACVGEIAFGYVNVSRNTSTSDSFRARSLLIRRTC
jgi:hypothetical protein